MHCCQKASSAGKPNHNRPAPTFTIDLHGERVDAARQMLDRELNAQFMRRASGGRVICGHGTGVLLRVIGEELARHPLVASHERAPGGIAAYVVRLVEFQSEGDL